MRILWSDAAVLLETGDLVIGDLHIGFERTMHKSGYRIIPVYRQIIAKVMNLIDNHKPRRLIILGDLKDSIGNPTDPELYQIEQFVNTIDIPMTVVLGNHDGGLKDYLLGLGIDVVSSSGFLDNDYYFFHGNARPLENARDAKLILGCHWHPIISLRDDNGRYYSDRAWLITPTDLGPRLLMLPAFNNLVGGATPDMITERYLHIDDAEVYLTDGTFLGIWGQIRKRLK